MLPSGPAGGGVRKSGVYPRGGSNAIAPASAFPSTRPLSDRSHGTCNAACDGSRRTTSERTSSHIGEIANLVRTRPSTENTNRTTAAAYGRETITSSVVPSGSAKYTEWWSEWRSRRYGSASRSSR